MHISNTDIEINLEHLPKKIEKEWIDRGFNHEQIKEWIDAGLSINDYEHAYQFKNSKNNARSESEKRLEKSKDDYEKYLKEIKRNQTSVLTSELIPNKELKEKCRKLCFECDQFDVDEKMG